MNERLWELTGAMEEAHEMLTRASVIAGNISGYRAGRAADHEYGIPADEGDPGWPLMNQLSDALGGLATVLAALRSDERLKDAADAERDADDHNEDLMDAARL